MIKTALAVGFHKEFTEGLSSILETLRKSGYKVTDIKYAIDSGQVAAVTKDKRNNNDLIIFTALVVYDDFL